MVAVYCENYKQHTNTVRRKLQSFVRSTGGASIYDGALNS